MVTDCNCDPSGSLRQGECHSHTSKDGRYVAGTCDCKRYVEGRRCDTCQNGYWNLKSDNADGCQGKCGFLILTVFFFFFFFFFFLHHIFCIFIFVYI